MKVLFDIEFEPGIISSNWGRDGKFELPLNKLSIQLEVGGEIIQFEEFMKRISKKIK